MSRVVDGSTSEAPVQRGATVRRLLGEATAYRGELLLALGSTVLGAATQAAAPWLVSQAIDNDILNGNTPGLARTLAGLLAVYAVGTLATRAQIFQVGSVLLDFGRRVLGLLTEPTSVVLYSAIVAEGTRFPDLVAAFFEHGPGRASAYLAPVLDEFARRGTLKLTDSHLAAELFVGMLRGDLHLRVVLGLRPPPYDAEIERFVHAAVRTFLDGCRTPGERKAGPSERKGAKSHA